MLPFSVSTAKSRPCMDMQCSLSASGPLPIKKGKYTLLTPTFRNAGGDVTLLPARSWGILIISHLGRHSSMIQESTSRRIWDILHLPRHCMRKRNIFHFFPPNIFCFKAVISCGGGGIYDSVNLYLLGGV